MRSATANFLSIALLYMLPKGRSRGYMKCEVERFERRKDLTIKDWIGQMETYFTIGQVPPEDFVGFMLMKIVPRHLNEIKQYQSLGYLELREKLVEVFAEPDMATVYLSALSSLSQSREESISDYMHRARLLVLKAHPYLAHAVRERILVTSFLIGLYDRQLAASLAVVKIQTAADAERLAAEGDAVRRYQRSRRANINSLHEEACGNDRNNCPGVDLQPLNEKEKELTAAFGNFSADRRLDIECSSGRRLSTRASLECLLCNGNHLVRDCPSLPSAKSNLHRVTGRDTDSSQFSVPRPSTANEPSFAFKRDGTAILPVSVQHAESPVRINDPAVPSRSEESTPGTPRMQLFFVLGAVQTLPVWILADSGSVRNLIEDSVYRRLPYQPPIRDPGNVRVIGGNGEALDLKVFTVLPVSLGTNLLWHEFGVVLNFPIEVLIGADILAPYL